MFLNDALRLPLKPRRLSIPLTLIATVALTLIVGGIAFFVTTQSIQPIGLLIPHQQLTPADVFERYLDAVWNEGNLDALSDLLAPDFTQHDVGMPEPIADADALGTLVGQFRGNLPGVTFTVDQAATDGDMVFARLTAANDRFSVPMTASARVVDGKLAEIWFDVTALMETQLAEWMRVRGVADWNAPVTMSSLYDLYNQSFPEHGLFGDIRQTPAGFRTWIDIWQRAFPDLQCTDDYIAAEGDVVLVHNRCTGTFQNTLVLSSNMRWEPTGEEMETDYSVLFRLENGKVAEFWWYAYNPLMWQMQACVLDNVCP